MSETKNASYQRRRVAQIVAGGTASIIATAVASNLLRIISSMTLTRLLDSRAFGVVGIVTTVAIILQLVSDIGVQPFVIRHERGDDRAFLDEIWTLRLIRSTFLSLLMAALSVPISGFLEKPEFAPVLAFWSINFIVDGLSSMAFATAVREQKLWRLTWSELAASLAQLFIAVALAVVLRSYWALVIAMFISAVIKSILSYRLFPGSRRRWSLSRERAREMWAFSRFIAPSSLMSVLILQADKVVLARMMPLATYGLYAVAATLSAAGPALASNYGRRVLYPAYAEAARSDPSSLRRIFYGKRRWITLAYMGAIGALGGGASLVVALLYDPRYAPVTQYLRLLSISGALILVNNAAEELLIAAGNIRATLYSNVVRAAWLGLGVAIAVLTGRTILLVVTFGLVEAAAMLSYWWNLHRIDMLNVREEGLGLAVGAFGAGLGYAVATVGLGLFHSL